MIVPHPSIIIVPDLLSDATLGLENMLLIVSRWDSGPPGRLGGRLFSYNSALCKELLRQVQQVVLAEQARLDEEAAQIEDEATAAQAQPAVAQTATAVAGPPLRDHCQILSKTSEVVDHEGSFTDGKDLQQMLDEGSRFEGSRFGRKDGSKEVGAGEDAGRRSTAGECAGILEADEGERSTKMGKGWEDTGRGGWVGSFVCGRVDEEAQGRTG